MNIRIIDLSVNAFGSVMRVALENYMNRHQAEFMSASQASGNFTGGLAGSFVVSGVIRREALFTVIKS